MTPQVWAVLVVFAITQISIGLVAYIRVLGRLTVIETLLRNGLTEEMQNLKEKVIVLCTWREGHQAIADLKIKEYDRMKEHRDRTEGDA